MTNPIDRKATHPDGQPCDCGPEKPLQVVRRFTNENGMDIFVIVNLEGEPVNGLVKYIIENKWSRAEHTITTMEARELVRCLLEVLEP